MVSPYKGTICPVRQVHEHLHGWVLESVVNNEKADDEKDAQATPMMTRKHTQRATGAAKHKFSL